MNKIKEFFNNIENKINEKKTACWTAFKTKLSQGTQEKIERIEEYIKRYNNSNIGETINTIIFVVVMVIIIRFFVCEIRWIPSGSMRPTLIENDRIVVERVSRFFGRPKRGDIMVFYPPSTKLSHKFPKVMARLTGIYCKDIAYIKRVVGLPGDKVEIKFEDDGSAYVYINDKKYFENYVKNVYEYPLCPNQNIEIIPDIRHNGMKCGPFELGEDEFFMMGDNRGNSQDSRYWGVLKGDRFIGRAVLLFWPLDRFRIIHRLKDNL